MIRSGLKRLSAGSIEAPRARSSSRERRYHRPDRAERRDQGAADLSGHSRDQMRIRPAVSGQLLDLGQKRGGGVARRKLRRVHTPGNSDRRIVPPHRYFVRRAVKFVALVEKIGRSQRAPQIHAQSRAVPRADDDCPRSIPTETWRPNVGLPTRTSTATSSRRPRSALTSFPWALGFCRCKPAQHAVS